MNVTWDQNRCCHAGVCVAKLPDVFKVVDGQFVIEPDNASDDEIKRVVAECPSGALQFAEE